MGKKYLQRKNPALLILIYVFSLVEGRCNSSLTLEVVLIQVLNTCSTCNFFSTILNHVIPFEKVSYMKKLA